jgi:abhydrolase domain-containing protein 12
MLSENYYQTLPTVPTALSLPDHIPRALKSRPTILFLHGNAATRAVPFRVQLCSMFTSRLQTNVLSLDYRGYGDSTGLPSEKGLVQDVWAAWNWLLDHGARPEDIAIVGHSLGTGAGSAFAYELVQSGQSARGLALLAPFSSLATLLDTYYILGLIPLMRPLEVFPGARRRYSPTPRARN